MEGTHAKQESETPSVIKVAREPAIIINGVPDLPPDCTSDSQPEVTKNAESQVDPRFGEWLEGRKVRKLFGDMYYVGKVVKYDGESNWYNILYDDGDQEDLEWCELEGILLPFDISIPLKTLVMEKCKLQGAGPDSRPKVGRPRKAYAAMDANTIKTSNVVSSQADDTMNNQMLMVGIESGQGQQSNNEVRLLPAPTSNDAMPTGGQLATITARGNAMQASNQPRKRGRPRKDASLSVNNPPKKRGRPPKNRSASGNSLALVTARAEKLKRENLRVQGTPPGSQ